MSAGNNTLSGARRALYAALAVAALVTGTFTATAAQAAPAEPVNTAPPVISGTAHVGRTLTVSDGTWTDANNGFTYTWSDGTNNDLTQLGTNTYTLQEDDLGKTITATVKAFGNATDPTATSAGVVVLANTVTNITPPTVSGDAVVGSTMTATSGTWAGPGVNLTYQWFQSSGNSGSEITGATGLSYVIQNDDIGNYVGLTVFATASNGDVLWLSDRTASLVVPTAPFATDAGLTSANKGDVQGSQAGDTATITIPSGAEGDLVYVFGYSTPTGLGFFNLNASKQFSVNLSTLAAGPHKLLVLDSNGAVIGWYGVAALAATGADLSPVAYSIGGGLIALGGLFLAISIRGRRRITATRAQ